MSESVEQTASASFVLTPLRGDVVVHQGHRTWILGACDSLNVAYCCVNHEIELPTRAHMVKHVKELGEHIIVRRCPRHGIETAAKPKDPQELPTA